MWPQNGQYTGNAQAAALPPTTAVSGPVNGEAPAKLEHMSARLLDRRIRAARIQHVGNEIGDLLYLALPEAARGRGRGADPKSARDGRRPRIVGHGILVHGDVGF